MAGILLLDEFGKEGVFRIGSKRHKKFVRGERTGIPEISKRRLEVLDGKKR